MADLMIQKLRNNEYFGMQDKLDKLYEESKNGRYFENLYDLITSNENIQLAFRNLKSNTGSKTKGTNGHTIKHLKKMDLEKLIRVTRQRLKDYNPHSVRRVLIPKSNGKMRPLGIPTIEDRFIQQMFLQVLEPIAEGKFHPQSYGFRPKRSTHDALARCYHLINHSFQHYCVDIDIKSFFDNVNHKKLMRQLWTIGVRDKQVLSESNSVVEKFYGDYNGRRFKSNGILVYPIEAVRHDIRGQRKPDFTIFNSEDRKSMHKVIVNISPLEIEMLRKGIYKSKSVLYENNRLSKYVAQKGCCGLTGERLHPYNAICHHRKPSAQGGTDEYDNLIVIKNDYHMLIHTKEPLKNKLYAEILYGLDLKAIKKLNKLRTEVGNPKLCL